MNSCSRRGSTDACHCIRASPARPTCASGQCRDLCTRVYLCDGVEFFRDQVRGKLPEAPLFTADGETTWRTHMWSRRIRAAISSHNERAKEDKGLRPLPVVASA